MNDSCTNCSHRRRYHGRGHGRCWAPPLCKCTAFVKPTAAGEVGEILHEISREEVAAAVHFGIFDYVARCE